MALQKKFAVAPVVTITKNNSTLGTQAKKPMTPAQPASVSIANLPCLLTIKQAAQILGVSVRTVHTVIKKRQLTYFKVRGVLRFEPAHIDEYLRKRMVRAA